MPVTDMMCMSHLYTIASACHLAPCHLALLKLPAGKARLSNAMALARILRQDGTTQRMPTAIPFSQLATVVQQFHRDDPECPSHRTLRRNMQNEIEELGNHSTPYGKLIQKIDFGLPEENIPCINPFALLFWMSHSCEQFGNLLSNNITGRAKLVFYSDGTVPGNVLRPDCGREVECFYWTILELPTWFRVRKFGWFTFCVIRTTLVQKIPGGIAAVWHAMLKVFFGDTWNFDTIGVRCGSSDGDFILRGQFACILADEKAIKGAWSVKGASGTKMCLCCKNIVGRMHVERGDYFAHYSWATPELFDPHTDDSFREMIQILTEVHAGGTRTQLDDLCQAFGISFNIHALIFDDSLPAAISPVTGTYWDWMHILVASGGIFQYEANQFVCAIREEGITFGELDHFASNVKWPSSQTRLSRTFFQDRIVVASNDPHLRGFAGEMFLVAGVLTLFIAMVLTPAGLLPEHCRCFSYICVILNILSCGEGAVGLVHELERAIASHHDVYLRLYPNCAKPKLHYLWHVPQCIRRWEANLSCFSAERKHRRVKDIAKHTYRHFEQHVLGKLLAEDIAGLKDTLKPTHLVSSRPILWAVPIFQLVDATAAAVHIGTSAVISIGTVKVGDLLWADGGSDYVFAIARGYISIASTTGDEELYAHVTLLEKVNDVVWRVSAEQVLLSTSLVKAVLAYVEVPEGIRPLVLRYHV